MRSLVLPGFLAVVLLAPAHAAAADATIGFHFSNYTPAQVKIVAGESVTWDPEPGQTFAQHPLVPVEGQGEPFGRDTGDTPYAYRFATPGKYRFYCTDHVAPPARR